MCKTRCMMCGIRLIELSLCRVTGRLRDFTINVLPEFYMFDVKDIKVLRMRSEPKKVDVARIVR